MSFEELFTSERPALVRRLARMVGSLDQAEELGQETFVRAWRRLPRDAAPHQQRAWLYRTATNLAVDELRRRKRGQLVALEEAETLASAPVETEYAVQEALARLEPAEAFVLRLRWDAGLAHREIAALLGVSTEATRKRVTRARARFLDYYRAASRDRDPLVLLCDSNDEAEACVSWLQRAGARVKRVEHERLERDLAASQALVVGGSYSDLDPRLYGEDPRTQIESPDLARDRRELAALRVALDQDIPVLGVCRGHQLLNIARGGNLFQDLHQDGVTRRPHRDIAHGVETRAGSLVRRLHGPRATVGSRHHQAVARLGRGVQVTARSADNVIEALELHDRRFALGMLWHPEEPESGAAGAAVAETLIAATERAA